MPYNHAGEIGDVWKHLPLCDILAAERPLRYHETNAAYAGYAITRNPRTDYGVFRAVPALTAAGHGDCAYLRALRQNGLDAMRYTGSPGLAMAVLSHAAEYFFHDMELEALGDIARRAADAGLAARVHTCCGDSIAAFLAEDTALGPDDFVFIDPYAPFDANEQGQTFLDVFGRCAATGAKTLLWYGFDSLADKRRIDARLRDTAACGVAVSAFSVRLRGMTETGCGVNPGVPGCGLACVNVSHESIDILTRYLSFMGACYAGAAYEGQDAALAVESLAYPER